MVMRRFPLRRAKPFLVGTRQICVNRTLLRRLLRTERNETSARPAGEARIVLGRPDVRVSRKCGCLKALGKSHRQLQGQKACYEAKNFAANVAARAKATGRVAELHLT